MKHSEVVEAILAQRVIAIVREPSSEAAVAVVDRLVAAGLASIEVSLVTPGAIEAIATSRERHDGVAAIGVGTALSVDDVAAARDAGAEFVVTPMTDPPVIRYAHELGLVVVPGAATPTEMVQAERAGADLVKVFPASNWSPSSLKDLLASLTGLSLVPTGGVTVADAAEWIGAGAVAVGMGSALGRIAAQSDEVRDFLRRMREA